MKLAFTVVSTPIGELAVAGEGTVVTHISNDVSRFLEANPDAARTASGPLAHAGRLVQAFLRAEITSFDIAYAPSGTAFQQSVWQALEEVPYGQTVSYTDIAEMIGRPQAFRAVANACGANPLPLIIPCHRVVHKSGNASGFAWGVDAKRYLLDMEHAGLRSFATRAA